MKRKNISFKTHTQKTNTNKTTKKTLSRKQEKTPPFLKKTPSPFS